MMAPLTDDAGETLGNVPSQWYDGGNQEYHSRGHMTRRLASRDSLSEPLPGQRVTYFLAPGRKNDALVACVRALEEAVPSSLIPSSYYCATTTSYRSNCEVSRHLAPRLHLAYYLNRQFIPPLERVVELLGENLHEWLSDLPRYHPSSGAIRHSTLMISQQATQLNNIYPGLNSSNSFIFPLRRLGSCSSLISSPAPNVNPASPAPEFGEVDEPASLSSTPLLGRPHSKVLTCNETSPTHFGIGSGISDKPCRPVVQYHRRSYRRGRIGQTACHQRQISSSLAARSIMRTFLRAGRPQICPSCGSVLRPEDKADMIGADGARNRRDGRTDSDRLGHCRACIANRPGVLTNSLVRHGLEVSNWFTLRI
ncbi:unnamed protein product [Protopolystoma xenopodis]|uniref:DNA-directed DNA polymerase n=1 Tax=Protopolystoma xenopodis TaxID=117903 RepID=A0A3S5FG04_9PLAT|nr:unnamed protein product [Protopolystoma xenopodis]